MPRDIFCNTKEDLQWLKDTHLKLINLYGSATLPNFNSFDMFGNEDSPEHILLYKETEPTRHSIPIAEAFQLSTGKYLIIKYDQIHPQQ